MSPTLPKQHLKAKQSLPHEYGYRLRARESRQEVRTGLTELQCWCADTVPYLQGEQLENVHYRLRTQSPWPFCTTNGSKDFVKTKFYSCIHSKKRCLCQHMVRKEGSVRVWICTQEWLLWSQAFGSVYYTSFTHPIPVKPGYLPLFLEKEY